MIFDLLRWWHKNNQQAYMSRHILMLLLVVSLLFVVVTRFPIRLARHVIARVVDGTWQHYKGESLNLFRFRLHYRSAETWTMTYLRTFSPDVVFMTALVYSCALCRLVWQSFQRVMSGVARVVRIVLIALLQLSAQALNSFHGLWKGLQQFWAVLTYQNNLILSHTRC